ncbi:DUF2157 domain-containing protein [Saccharomonospora iraqiensis]|uniref:DUF2157 domain-containing protein n=1 Tax=Saccharomonospora iraqiensis TaxID=52698 RepID=UPI00047E829C|nr:DUF2157 domain-containing protein [Saccharomonospora iraqiensis]
MMRRVPPRRHGDNLTDRLDRWVAHGLLTREQADRILAAERESTETAEETGRTPSPVAEALGYVGGVLVLVATGLVAGRYWSELGVAGRLSVAFGAAALLLAAGASLRPRLGETGRRLRAVCWLLSAAAVALGTALLGEDVLDLPGEVTPVLAAAVTACYAAALWPLSREIPQQAAVVVALAVTAGTATALLPGSTTAVTGLAVWGVGTAWVLLGWGGLVTPRSPTWVLGGGVVIVGSLLMLDPAWGTGVALGTAAALVAAGVWQRDLLLLAIAAVATLVAVPATLDRFFPDTLTAPLALLATGALLIVGALYTARRGRPAPTRYSRRPADPRLAAGLAAGVVTAVATAVVLLGVS